MSDNLTIPSPIGYRPPRRQRTLLSPDMQRKLVIAGGIVGMLSIAVLVGTWVGRSTGEIPVLVPDERPVRVKPDDPGGLKVMGVNNGLYEENDTEGSARLAAAPEDPNPSALRAPPEPRTQPQPAATATVPPATTPSATTPSATVPPAQGHAAERPPARPAPAAPRTAAAPGANPTTSAAAPPTRTTAPDGARPANVAPPVAPPAAPSVAPLATQTQPAPRPEAKLPAGRYIVQLVAVQSEGAAQAEWQSLRQRHPDLFGARQPVITRTERDGRTFWRVRTGGFTDLADARGFCDRVRAKGASCMVAEL